MYQRRTLGTQDRFGRLAKTEMPLVRETQALYNTENRSNAVEKALRDALRFKKLQMLMALKGRIDFDEASVGKLREAEAGT